MAFTDAEIAELKSLVPQQHRPRAEHSDLLSNRFYSAADVLASAARVNPGGGNPLTDDNAREMAGLIFADDPEASASFILTGAQASKQAYGESHEEKQRRKDRETYDLIRNALDQRLAELDVELAEIDARLGVINDLRSQIADKLDAIDDLERLVANGTLDPNNPAHAALLRRAGYSTEDTEQDDFAERLRHDRADLAHKDGALETEWNRKMKRRGEVVAERREVEAARAEIESADTPQAMENAERRAQTLLGSQQLGEAAYQTESQKAKQIAADAVGVSAKSEDYNREAAALNEAKVIESDLDAFDPDASKDSQGTSAVFKLS